jgi:hypothetical protein
MLNHKIESSADHVAIFPRSLYNQLRVCSNCCLPGNCHRMNKMQYKDFVKILVKGEVNSENKD